MGTVVQAGSALAVVVATGTRAAFGRIAAGLGDHEPETAFQAGLRRFSMLLVEVAAVLLPLIFIINVALHRPVLEALMFSLAIAIGISPQLLPAIVSTSLAAGSRALARRRILVKRLVCIEDLGDIDVLLTDKTGTLTEGRIAFMRSIGPGGSQDPDPAVLGLVATEVTAGSDGAVAGGNPLDAALWAGVIAPAERDAAAAYRRRAVLPFDHDRRLVTVLVDNPSGERLLVTKGAPESVFDRAKTVPDAVRAAADREFSAGNRVVAVATRPVPGATAITTDDERDLEVRGLLVFLDPPSPRRARRWPGWPASASRRRSSPGTTAPWPPASTRSWASPAPAAWSAARTSMPPTTTRSSGWSARPRCSPASPPSTRRASCGPSGAAAPW